MFRIQQITDDANQRQTVVLPDGTAFVLTMYYSDTQQGWFITELTYAPSNFTLNSLRITLNPNMLYQWKNVLPFGIGCFPTKTTREPTQQQDFSSELFQLFVLSSAEVDNYTDFLQGGTLG